MDRAYICLKERVMSGRVNIIEDTLTAVGPMKATCARQAESGPQHGRRQQLVLPQVRLRPSRQQSPEEKKSRR